MSQRSNDCYGEIRGFLEAFARPNCRTNHGYSFDFSELPEAATLQSSVAVIFGGALNNFCSDRIIDWEPTVRQILEKWLFQFRTDHFSRLKDRSGDFPFGHDQSRNEAVDWLLERLKALGDSLSMSRVQVETAGFYECDWDDFAFETDGRRYLLHLGVSD